MQSSLSWMHHSRGVTASALNALAALLLALASLAAMAGPVGQVDELSGPVRITDRQGKERAAAKGAEVSEGDRIVTADGGRVQLRLTDGGYLSIRPNTELVFKRYMLNESVPAQSSFWVSLLKGGFRSITGMIGKINPGGYRIETDTATIGVRGTDHEPHYIPQPKAGDRATGEPGTYDKLNSGRSYLETPKGTLELKPGQVGFAPRLDMAPRLLPKAPEFFRDQPAVPKQYLGKDHGGDASALREASSGDTAAGEGADAGVPPAVIALTPTTSILASSTNLLQPLPAVAPVQVPVPTPVSEIQNTVSPAAPLESIEAAAPLEQNVTATTPAADAPGQAVAASTPAADTKSTVNGGSNPSPNGNANGQASTAAGNGNAGGSSSPNGNANGQSANAAAGGNGNGAGGNSSPNGNANGQVATGGTPAASTPASSPAAPVAANPAGNVPGAPAAANPPAANVPAPAPAAPVAANPAGNVPGAPAAANPAGNLPGSGKPQSPPAQAAPKAQPVGGTVPAQPAGAANKKA